MKREKEWTKRKTREKKVLNRMEGDDHKKRK